MLAVVDPGDEVIVFEPFYENYGPDAILSGAVPRFVPLREPDWSFDAAELARAFSNRTRAIIVNTPNNPTGKVFTREELETIAALCRAVGRVALTDEIYEHILYDGASTSRSPPPPGMGDRTVTSAAVEDLASPAGASADLAPPALTAASARSTTS